MNNVTDWICDHPFASIVIAGVFVGILFAAVLIVAIFWIK